MFIGGGQRRKCIDSIKRVAVLIAVVLVALIVDTVSGRGGIQAKAATIASGEQGDTTWVADIEKGTLTITPKQGTDGDLKLDYESGINTFPDWNWYEIDHQLGNNKTNLITKIIIKGHIYSRNMSKLFEGFKKVNTIVGMENVDTSQAEYLNQLFEECESLTSVDVSHFNTSKATTMEGMFSYCENIKNVDLSNFDTSHVTDMHDMFESCESMVLLKMSNFDTSQVTNMKRMFWECESIQLLDVSHFNTSKVTDMNQMFYGCISLASLDVSNFDTSNVTDMSGMFYFNDINYHLYGNEILTSLDVSNFDTSHVTDMRNMFSGLNKITALDVSNFDTSHVTDMSFMFYECKELISLDVSNFNTSNVINMNAMFDDCRELQSLDVNNFNTSNTVNMRHMFSYCLDLKELDVSDFDTSKVTDISHMFQDCQTLKFLNLNNWNTSEVTTMRSLFSGCQSMLSLDVSNFNTSKVTDMGYMFDECVLISSLNLKNFDTSRVTDMSGMFDSCGSIESLDLSNFDTSKVADMSHMFYMSTGPNHSYKPKLQYLNLSSFDTTEAVKKYQKNIDNGKHVFGNNSDGAFSEMIGAYVSSFPTPFTIILGPKCYTITSIKDGVIYKSGIQYNLLGCNKGDYIIQNQENKKQFDYQYTRDSNKQYADYSYDNQFADAWTPEMAGTWVIKAKENTTPAQYTVTFKDGLTNEIISSSKVNAGTKIDCPTSPTHDNYRFVSWLNADKLSNVKSDVTVIAQYEKIDTPKKQYTIAFKDSVTGKIISSIRAEEGTSVAVPVAPKHDGYEFMSWDNKDKLTNIQYDVIVTAMYKKIEKPVTKYTVIFKDGLANTIISSSVVEEGANVSVPTAPEHDGYEFVSWDNEDKLTDIQSDVTVIATYKKIEKPDNQSKQTVLPVKSDGNNQTISDQPNELEQTGINLPSLLVPLSAILSVVLIAHYRRRSK